MNLDWWVQAVSLRKILQHWILIISHCLTSNKQTHCLVSHAILIQWIWLLFDLVITSLWIFMDFCLCPMTWQLFATLCFILIMSETFLSQSNDTTAIRDPVLYSDHVGDFSCSSLLSVFCWTYRFPSLPAFTYLALRLFKAICLINLMNSNNGLSHDFLSHNHLFTSNLILSWRECIVIRIPD